MTVSLNFSIFHPQWPPREIVFLERTVDYAMQSRENEKAHRYIESLDNARSQGNWNEVPEFIRKVTKHAPQELSTF